MGGVYKPGLYQVGDIKLGRNIFQDSEVGVYRARDPFLRRNLSTIGVYGSAFDDYKPEDLGMDVDKNRVMATIIGREIAKRDAILINGACNGFPHDAAVSAMNDGGYVIGFSAEGNEQRHRHYGNVVGVHDIIFYPGIDISPRRNFIGRSTLGVYTTKEGLVVIGGSFGTNQEVAVAAELGVTVAFMKGTGGVADIGKDYYESIRKRGKPTFLEDTDPVALVERLFEEIERVRPLVAEQARKRGRKKTNVLEMIADQTEPFFLSN